MARMKRLPARKYLDNWLEHLDGDVSHSSGTYDAWLRLGVEYSDVLYVLERGRVTDIQKETPHGYAYTIEGRTIDDIPICVSAVPEITGRGIHILSVRPKLEQDNDGNHHDKNIA